MSSWKGWKSAKEGCVAALYPCAAIAGLPCPSMIEGSLSNFGFAAETGADSSSLFS